MFDGMSEGTDSPEDRMALRRARRWRRRARIAAPFMALPVMLGLLVLSVDLIEYRPSSHAHRPNERPPSTAQATRNAPGPGAMGLIPEAALSVSVVASPKPEANPTTSAASALTARSAWSKDPSDTARP